ncbi:unnamed protein product [Dovyalis caffra]|uniref:Uncharacterized protein n=1 Tax=Dovyalis caffra TaxID=77055 RepID=A0AAV1RZ96_9ROSI|nr:unnamed protein product [Dovyalis caffra]
MGSPALCSFRFAIFFSLSLTTSSSPPSILSFKPRSPPPSLPPSIPKATPSDLLSVLGPTTQSSKINPLISQQLSSCLKFLVPFTPSKPKTPKYNSINGCYIKHRRLGPDSVISVGRSNNEEKELVWWPPEPVLEVARLALDSGGDPDSIHRTLDPTVLPVPDVERCKENKCELTRTPYGRRFISEELNSYLEFLFELIVARGPSVGFNVSLNRYDLFHGHVFIARDTGRLVEMQIAFHVKMYLQSVSNIMTVSGVISFVGFHAREYPAYDEEAFPYNTGYCQKGSNVTYDDSMNLRNILWLAPLPSNSTKAWAAPGVLVVLDARPDGIIYRDLIPEYVNIARTIYEDELGEVVVDVNYLNVGDTVPNYQIFIC